MLFRSRSRETHLGIQLVDHLRRDLDVPPMHRTSNLLPTLDAGEVDRWAHARLLRKLFGRVAVAFDEEVVGDESVDIPVCVHSSVPCSGAQDEGCGER